MERLVKLEEMENKLFEYKLERETWLEKLREELGGCYTDDKRLNYMINKIAGLNTIIDTMEKQIEEREHPYAD